MIWVHCQTAAVHRKGTRVMSLTPVAFPLLLMELWALLDRLSIATFGFSNLRSTGDSTLVRISVILLAFASWGVGVFSHAAEGPTTIAVGEWSKAVDDNRGYQLRGRLVLCENRAGSDLREVAVYVELQDASESRGKGMQLFCEMGKTDLRPEYKGGLKCEMHDKDKKLVKSTGYPFGGGVPKSEWVTLPCDATIRLRATPFGLRRAKAMAISPEINKLWVIGDEDSNEYYLSGTFTIAPAESRLEKDGGHIWRGTIVLPAVRIKNKGE